MKFEIKNDLLYRDGVQVPNKKTVRKNRSVLPANPDLVIHYTVGENFDAMVAALTLPGAGGGAAHIVLGQEGEVTQIETFRHSLWHAGASYWKGRNSLNAWSIGIEICNRGWLNERRADGYWRQSTKYRGQTYHSRWYSPDEVVVQKHPNPAVYVPTFGPGTTANTPAWAKYTDKQMEVLDALVPVIIDHYNVREVVGHDEITPGRKQDPGPDMYNRRPKLWNDSRGDTPKPDVKPPVPNPSPVAKLPVLGRGDSGQVVKRLQIKLAVLGFTEVGAADGDFGPKTDMAVRNFQRKKGLTVDGIVGPNTYSKLGDL